MKKRRRKKRKLIVKNLIKLIVLFLILVFLIVLTISKIYRSRSFKVNFNSDGGSAVKKEVVKYGEKAYTPQDPTKEGYEFNGWYINDKLYDFDSKVKKDITLTAKWDEIQKDNPVNPDENNNTNPAPPNENNNTNTEEKDPYPYDHLSTDDAKRIFSEKKALVVSDSMGEGLSAYKVLNEENVIWHRGRRVDNMDIDIDKILEFNPSYIFMSYGANDIKWWGGNAEKFINAYKAQIENLQSKLPNTKIIINSVLPVGEKAIEKDASFTHQEEFNTALKALAKEMNLDFIENGFIVYTKENPFSSDGVHPKSFFFFAWGKHMASYLEKN